MKFIERQVPAGVEPSISLEAEEKSIGTALQAVKAGISSLGSGIGGMFRGKGAGVDTAEPSEDAKEGRST